MSEPERKIITLTGDDGSETECQLLDILEFDGREYAVLLADEGVVIMQFDEVDGEARFRVIEDDDEFIRVRQFVEALAEDS